MCHTGRQSQMPQAVGDHSVAPDPSCESGATLWCRTYPRLRGIRPASNRTLVGLSWSTDFDVRCLIGEPLPDDAPQCVERPRRIIHAELHSVVLPEIELRHVAVQVLRLAVLIDTLHAALEHAVEAFNRVRVDLAPAILADAVPHEIMLGKVLVQVRILTSFIR